MKIKALLLLIAVSTLLTVNLKAQSLQFEGTVYKNLIGIVEQNGSLSYNGPNVKNISKDTVTVKVKFEPQEITPDHFYEVCLWGALGNCFPPTNTVFDKAPLLKLAPGATIGDPSFRFSYYPYDPKTSDGKPSKGTAQLVITYYVVSNPTDNVSFTLSITSNIVSVNEDPTVQFAISPNPVSELLNVSLSANENGANLDIYSLEGSLVRSISVPATITSTTINCNDLLIGSYIYRINSNGKLLKSGVFQVNR